MPSTRSGRADVDRAGLETTAGYKPKTDTGSFSYATHAAVVAVDAAAVAVFFRAVSCAR